MPKIYDLLKDPEFQALNYQDKKGVLSHFDNSFSSLPEPEQDKVMQHFNLNQPKPAPDEIHPVAQAASDIYTPALVGFGGVGGAAAGAAAGAPTGPGAAVTTAAGSALGMAAGEAAAEGIDRLTGLKQPIQTPGEAVSETGKNILHGAEFEAGGAALTKAANFAIRPLVGAITDSGHWVMNKAKDLGIELSPAEVVRSKGLSLLESLMDIAPVSGDIADKFHMRQAKELIKERNRLLNEHGSPDTIEALGEKIQQAADDLIRNHTKVNVENQIALKDRLLQKLGSTQTYAETGLSGQEALKAASEARYNESRRLYEAVSDYMNNDTAYVPENYRKSAIKLLNQQRMASSSLQDPEALTVLNDVSGNSTVAKMLESVPDALRPKVMQQLQKEQIGKMTWEQMAADRSRLGKLIAQNDPSYGFSSGAKGMKMVSDEAAGVYKQLFKALDQDMQGAVKQAGPEAENAFNLARSYYGESKQLFNTPLMTRLAKADPEKVVDMVFKPGAVTPIRMTRKAIGNEAFDNLKRSFTNRLFETPEGMPLTPELLKTRLKKYGAQTIGEIYGPDASMLGNFADQLEAASPELKDNQFFKTLLRKDPEKVIDYLIRPNNTANAEKLMSGLGERIKQSVSKGFMTKILQDAAMNSHGEFSPNMLDSTLNKYGDETLSKWLPKEALSDLKDFAQISMRLPRAAMLGNNPSGTGRVILGAAGGMYFFYNPKRAMKLAVPAAILAKLYFSPMGRKYLLDGLTTTLKSPESQAVFNRLASTALALIHEHDKEE